VAQYCTVGSSSYKLMPKAKSTNDRYKSLKWLFLSRRYNDEPGNSVMMSMV
jgi:hypothetical protein